MIAFVFLGLIFILFVTFAVYLFLFQYICFLIVTLLLLSELNNTESLM